MYVRTIKPAIYHDEHEHEDEDEDELIDDDDDNNAGYELINPTGLCVDDDRLYVCNEGRNRIVIIDKKTDIIVTCISNDTIARRRRRNEEEEEEEEEEIEIYAPQFIAVDSTTLYLIDLHHHIKLFNKHTCAYVNVIGGSINSIGPRKNTDVNELYQPKGVAVTTTTVIVVDYGNFRIQVYDKHTGVYVRTIQYDNEQSMHPFTVAAYVDEHDAEMKLVVGESKRIVIVGVDEYEFVRVLSSLAALWMAQMQTVAIRT